MTLVDLHSHLVPGVDDGARTLDDALEGIGRMVERGYRGIVTTPHFAASLTLDERALEERLEEMRVAWEPVLAAARERWPELDLRRGLEIMIDVPGADLDDERLRLGGTRFVLVEWPWMQVPPHSSDLLRDIAHGGVRPVVAHPERYRGLDPDMTKVAAWREAGALVQVNTGSLAGRYGPDARRRAFTVLERGWADYLATDFHGRPELELTGGAAESELAGRDGGGELFALLAGTNPGRLLADEEPLPAPPLSTRKGLWGRFREMWE